MLLRCFAEMMYAITVLSVIDVHSYFEAKTTVCIAGVPHCIEDLLIRSQSTEYESENRATLFAPYPWFIL